MINRIQPSDIPQAIITPTTTLSAGRGWARLVRGALPRGDHVEVSEISAVDGLLYIEIEGRYTSLTRLDIEWARAESGKICEICSEPGSLRTDAGWMRARCDEHANDDIEAIANVMGTPITNVTWLPISEAIPLRDYLAVREKARRAAIWSLSNAKRLGKLPDELSREETSAAAVLARIRQFDKDFPVGPASSWTVEKVKARVTPSSERHIRLEDIPEPWATRFLTASIGSTICAAGHPLDDWENFLSLWEKENDFD